jgi:hypothetical protein
MLARQNPQGKRLTTYGAVGESLRTLCLLFLARRQKLAATQSCPQKPNFLQTISDEKKDCFGFHVFFLCVGNRGSNAESAFVSGGSSARRSSAYADSDADSRAAAKTNGNTFATAAFERWRGAARGNRAKRRKGFSERFVAASCSRTRADNYAAAAAAVTSFRCHSTAARIANLFANPCAGYDFARRISQQTGGSQTPFANAPANHSFD